MIISTPREALEAAAKACDHVATELGYQIEEADPEADAWDDGFVEGCSRCVAAIRAIPAATPDPLTAKLVEALQDSRRCVQAFLDMVNVIQRVQALPIPAILETAKHNCPIILQYIDAALAAAEERG